jgi:hypothetical protein
MKNIPKTENSLVLRTDFSDNSAWESICAAIQDPVGEFRAYVECVSDPEYDGLTVEQLTALFPKFPYLGDLSYDSLTAEQVKQLVPNGFSFIFIVDRTALTHPDHPILVLDLEEEHGRTFRVIPSEMWGVENNLSIGNMVFSEFADNVDKDGIFRGFPAS